MEDQVTVAGVEAEVGIKAEFEISRVEPGINKDEHVFMRAVRHADASGNLANGAWGGANPHGFVEVVITGGLLLGTLKAGGRVLIDITPL